MKIEPLPLSGAYTVDVDPRSDERGFFARTFCVNEFAALGMSPRVVQCNISFNQKAGTVRGMHYQIEPHPEVKLVRCTQGAILDVIVDLRPDSATFKQHVGVELTAKNRRALYIPAGFAHGFQTLADETEVFYQMSDFYAPDCARGVRWDDPALNIRWPRPISCISDKDLTYPDFVI